ncbi:MAG: class I SAM-dependent methyltransferase, partial [Solirubrobacteraceae bacterium]
MLQQPEPFQALNAHKANFDAIYELPDPREYYRVLCGLDYVIPNLAKDVFRALIRRSAEEHGRPVKVLDLGCSYGINAALIRYPLDLERLAGRYAHPEMHALETGDLIALDRRYFDSWPEQIDARFVGLDASPAAIRYATDVGLLDDGIVSNLERREPAGAERARLRDVDMIISTGCVGYTTKRTFRRVLDLRDGAAPPWVASFVLRMFPYDGIAEELARFGLVTEKLDGVTFVQRRFHSETEFAATMDKLEARGVDPTGKEADGLFHAELFVSRPAAAVERAPLGDIVSVTRGENGRYGRRYRRVADD